MVAEALEAQLIPSVKRKIGTKFFIVGLHPTLTYIALSELEKHIEINGF